MAPHPPPSSEPALEEFMRPDASFLTELRKRGQEMAEDFVAFELYVTEGTGYKENADGQQKTTDLAKCVAARVLHVTETYRAAYPWHFEAFAFFPLENDSPTFEPSSSSSSSSPSYPSSSLTTTSLPLLQGRVCVGENVEDEWFVVWLLQQATADPELAALGLTARVWDADGDFLLIQAALVIPDWLDPDNSMFRVWIRGGRFHFLSEVHHPLTAVTRPLTAQRALLLLASSSSSSSSPTSTVAPWLDGVLDERLGIYPDAIEGSKHRAACYLPLSIAVLLRERPYLVAAAVRALRSREPGELLRMMKGERGSGGGGMGGGGGGGELRFEPRPLVPVCVTFSRYLFGQVEADELQPPKAYLTAIADVMTMGGERGGRMGEKKDEGNRGRDRMKAAVSRGVRLACGLEILYWRSKQGEEKGREGGQEEWKAYLARLQGKGFWDGAMEGSKEYRERMTLAKKAFQERRASSCQNGGAAGESGGGEETYEIIDEILLKEGDKMKVEDFAQALSELRADDGEEWMEIVPGELDELLEKYGQPLTGEGEGRMFFDDDEEDAEEEEEREEEEEKEEEEEGGRDGRGEDLKSMVEGMKHFIGAMAGLEGAEITGGRRASTSDDGNGLRAAKKGEDVSFDVSRLLDILEGRDIERSSRAGMMVGRTEGGMHLGNEEDGEEEVEMVGRSKERVYTREVKVKSWNGGDSDDEDDSDEEEEEDEREGEKGEKEAMEAYITQMERELKGTTLAYTFDRVPRACANGDGEKRDKLEKEDENVDEDEELPPVDVDLNLVRHLLESVAAQGSLPGPASNMLGEVMKSMEAD
ncbi:sgt1 [Nannochloropsis oceanica]